MNNQVEDGFRKIISTHQVSNGLVGLGAIVLQHGELKGITVSGEREYSSGISLDIGDKWHIGSVTKSITATMIARLVDKGVLDWDTSIDQAFSQPDLIHEAWNKVTILDLLTHTSGASANFPIWVHFKRPPEGPERIAQRKKAAFKLLRKRPSYLPRSKFIYSNAGYTIAGVIAETVTGCSWENLIRDEVFRPLGLASAGFGPPIDNSGLIDQPRGHRKRFLSRRKVSVGTSADNTPIIGPAGTIHMNLTDLAKYVDEHLRGEHGGGQLLGHETYKVLHSPVLDDYACGWVVDRAGTIWHNGSNTMWYAFVAFEPSSSHVIVVTANDPGIELCEAVAGKILEESKVFFS